MSNIDQFLPFDLGMPLTYPFHKFPVIQLGVVFQSLENCMDNKMQEMQDQVQSVEGRFSQSSPFSQIGDDNIMHGAQWIVTLPKENFTVQLAYAGDKDTLYEIAQRYNYYLKDSLSYFEVNDNETDKDDKESDNSQVDNNEE